MLRGWFIAALLCALLHGPEARALQSEVVSSGQVSAQLLADVSTVQAGQGFLLGVKLTMAPGWHTYCPVLSRFWLSI